MNRLKLLAMAALLVVPLAACDEETTAPVTGTANLVSVWKDDTNNDSFYLLADGSLNYELVYQDDNGSTVVIPNGGPFVLNTWAFCAFTYNGADRMLMKFNSTGYQRIDLSQSYPMKIPESAPELGVGTQINAGAWADGKIEIDRLQIYNRVLTESELETIRLDQV